MSRAVDNLPPTARGIALLLSSTPSVQDAQPGVLHQLLEFAHRYTLQVLTDAKVYAEHAGRSENRVDMDDVVLAVQARVGWEYGGRVPQEYILSLATQTNSQPLPPVPEVFGVRAPPASEALTSIDFDLVPNKPPPGVKLYDEEVEEIEETESESEEDEDMERADIPEPNARQSSEASMPPPQEPFQPPGESAPFPISAIPTPSDMEMLGTPGGPPGTEGGDDEGSDAGDEDGLFAGGDDDDDSDGMEEVQSALEGDGDGPTMNGVKRKLQEDDDYD